MPEQLTCQDCGKQFPRKSKLGPPAQRCPACNKKRQKEKASARAKKWQKENPERAREVSRNYIARNREAHKKKAAEYRAKVKGTPIEQERRRRAKIKAYGLTVEEHDLLLEAQDGKCAICHKPPAGKQELGIDHDHETGFVRGLLCTTCNTGLGHFKDNRLLLEQAIEYLDLHEEAASEAASELRADAT